MVFKQKRWDLTDVLAYREGKQFDDFLSGIEKDVKEFEGLRPTLGSMDRAGLETAIALKEKITEKLFRLGAYGGLCFAADTQSEKINAFRKKTEEIVTVANNRLRFFELWLGSLDEHRAKDIMPTKNDYKAYVDNIRNLSKYDLNEKAEEAISIKDLSGSSAWKSLYDTTTSAFNFIVRDGRKAVKDKKGKTKLFLNEELNLLITGREIKMGSLAYKARFNKYAANGRLLFDIYSNIVKDYDDEASLRGFSTPISRMNVENGIEDEAVEALLSACRKNNGIFQRFFGVKARLLGVDKLSRSNLYTAIDTVDKKMEYSDAVEQVLDTFRAFDSRFSDLARLVFEKDHVDSETRPGKRGGAFCEPWSAKGVPYILLNYTGNIESVSTIAHESGHAIHSLLASSHPILAGDGMPHNSGLPLAETASIFAEMILNDRLMATTEDPKIKRTILIREIEKAYAAITRQAYFVIFEKQAHEAIKKGASTDEICDMYYESLKEQFGESVSIPEEFKWEWSYIPHIFHTPFYCYAYSFGSLLTYAMYDRYGKNPEATRDEMVKLLSYGGSRKPSEILKEIGIDIKSEAFWQSGFDVLKERVAELEKLI